MLFFYIFVIFHAKKNKCYINFFLHMKNEMRDIPSRQIGVWLSRCEHLKQRVPVIIVLPMSCKVQVKEAPGRALLIHYVTSVNWNTHAALQGT